ncbi:YrhK family protein [Halobacillus locisalis]|uniref:YrhK family protein n=2 Tax=Halobacillus locisalis TaxID=220753 RepID=A0A838CTP1_9BACI|nr:YrhK family protein [Halobacillus locisalis]
MGRHGLFFKKRYEVLYTLNDFLLGIWYLLGSICLYFEISKEWGILLFMLGSIQILIRPSIRIIHRFHVKKHYIKEYDSKQ